jgi:hypothetical protein
MNRRVPPYCGLLLAAVVLVLLLLADFPQAATVLAARMAAASAAIRRCTGFMFMAPSGAGTRADMEADPR